MLYVCCFQEVNMRLSKMDELDALIAGVLFVDGMNAQECYYWAPPDEVPVHSHQTSAVSTSLYTSGPTTNAIQQE